MSILNKSNLNLLLKQENAKTIKYHENIEMLEQFSYNNNYLFNFLVKNCSMHETGLMIGSTAKYIEIKDRCLNNKQPSKFINYQNKQIVMVELGINYNKLSYKHPCVVLANLDDRLFVVPCTSRRAKRDKSGEIRSGYLEFEKTDGFEHTTTVILKDATCINKEQVISTIKENGKYKKISDDAFIKIVNKLHEMLFSWQYFNLSKLSREVENLKSEKLILEKEIEILKYEKQKNESVTKEVALNLE